MKCVLYFSFFLGAVFLFGCSDTTSSEATDTTSIETCYDVSIVNAGNRQTNNICSTRENGRSNGLGVTRFLRFSVASSSTVSILVDRTSGLNPADPDILLLKEGIEISNQDTTTINHEEMTVSLDAGNYVVAIKEFKYAGAAIFQTSKPVSSANVSTFSNQERTHHVFTISDCTSGINGQVSGIASFERVKHKGSALDYSNIERQPIREAVVEVICNGGVYSSGVTNDLGEYSLNFPLNQASFVRVKAQMFNENAWDVSVVDNINGDALYVMDGASFTESVDQGRQLIALSGWGGSSYTGVRTAAPFAILDSIRKAKDIIYSVAAINLPTLEIHWSKDNSSTTVIGTFYDNSEITLLGAENSDTDEYDEHVIIHEWGHYFEDLLSRTDSIGGNHQSGDILDIRVAFGEGFGNAFSAIALNDPIYNDSNGLQQGAGFTINMENNNCRNAGWFSECSIQSVLYDIFDATNDGADNLQLNFSALYNVMVNAQKNTQAFTSIFSFIKPLKDQNQSSANAIDNILGGQLIDPVSDVYGSFQQSVNPGDTDQLPIYEIF